MAYGFAFSNSNRIYSNAIASQSAPITIAMNFNSTSTGGTILGGLDTLNGNNFLSMQPNQAVGNRFLSVLTRDTGTANNASTTPVDSVIVNTWQNAVGVWQSTTSRYASINTTASTANTATVNPTFNELHLGTRWQGTPTSALALAYYAGNLAEVAVWYAELNVDEINSLYKGFKPTRIRPQSLVYYVPLVRELIEPRSGVGLTAVNAPFVSNHPRVY
jgi:hypothetical protein